MTIIEFYDKNAIENIASAMLCKPEKVIFVGDNHKHMERSIALYREILSKHSIDTELSYKAVNKNSFENIVDILSQIVDENEDCVFDLTGGEDLYLVAVGVVMNKYHGKIQCHRFNFRTDTIIDCDTDGNVCKTSSFDISVEDLIRMNGGVVVTDPERELHTVAWDLNKNFICDVETMWEICRKNARLWNAHIGTLGKIVELFVMPDELTVCFDKSSAELVLKQHGMKYAFVSWIMYELQKHGLINSLVMNDTVSFVCKNEQVKTCLTTAGQILELIVAANMLSLKDRDGQALYHDVRVGVVIDWDGNDETESTRTVNEIDVVAMKGAIPIFVSCKNGDFDANELYKLDAVAKRFGGKYVKKALVTAELEKLGERAEYLRARMDDMAIRRVENVDEMTDSEFERILKSLWSN